MSNTKVVTYTYPRSCPSSRKFNVSVNGTQVQVYHTGVADFACISFEGTIDIEITVEKPVTAAAIRPVSRGIQQVIDNNRILFTLTRPENLSIEIQGLPPLFFFGNALETDVPSPDNPDVVYFKGGQVYEVDKLVLKENQTLYIEGGAVVRGMVYATGANNVTVRGRGIFDGSFYEYPSNRRRLMVFEDCKNVRVEDIIMIEPTAWMLILALCQDACVRNIKQIGEVMSSDGIDVVASRNILIEDCFICNNDDCVVIKALNMQAYDKNSATLDWRADVDNVLVQNCVFINGRCGNAMEIGYELRTESVKNITFKNCDVLSVHGQGAVFSIHNSDRAVISNVLYEDIRIEHCYDRLIDFRIIRSRYGKDETRGQIRNVHLKNINFKSSIFNVGTTISLISGFDAQHTVEGVIFEDFYIDGKKVTHPDELDIYTRYANGIEFR